MPEPYSRGPVGGAPGYVRNGKKKPPMRLLRDGGEEGKAVGGPYYGQRYFIIETGPRFGPEF